MQRCLHFSTFWYSSYYLKRVTTSKIEISTFDVVIILNAIGKFRTSKWCFSWIFKEFISMFWIYLWRKKRSLRRKSNLSHFLCYFWRSDRRRNDQLKSHFRCWEKITPVVVVKFDVPTPSRLCSFFSLYLATLNENLSFYFNNISYEFMKKPLKPYLWRKFVFLCFFTYNNQI